MATATTIRLNQPLDLSHIASMPTDRTATAATPTTPLQAADLVEEAIKWAQKLRPNLEILSLAKEKDAEAPFEGLKAARKRIDEELLTAPRRKAAEPTKAALANLISRILYPEFPEDSLKPIIRYDAEIVQLRALILAQREADKAERTAQNEAKNWNKRILKQGPWDAELDPVSRKGAPSLPMPVKIADKQELAPFFAHLKDGGDDHPIDGAESGEEPYYGTKLLEFPKGVLYENGRMDLCKMVVGPPHIEDLMKSLETNPFTKHFLLGNNVIGPTGARAIAGFIEKYPTRMETWYLAGNCIDAPSFNILVDSLVESPVVTNLWVKRNPLGPESAENVFRVIKGSKGLRTLDLDQTELGDIGVQELFSRLAEHAENGSSAPLALRTIYLNATGIGPAAAEQIARYLRSPSCTLTSLFMSNNPLGTKGALALAEGLKQNTSLERLSMQSTGLTDESAIAILQALSSHARLTMLDLGQSYATEDLGMRYNWLTDTITTTATTFIRSSQQLRYFNLGSTALKTAGLNEILAAVSNSSSLLYYLGKSIYPQLRDYDSVKRGQEMIRLSGEARQRMKENVATTYEGMGYDEFCASEKRWLVSPLDVRKIDSVYRNRDAGLARRGLKVLEKWWEEGDGTLEMVMGGEPSSP